MQGYRPGGLASQGFAPEELARLRPGIICVSLSAYGHAGPWSGKRGFDSLVQTATGFNHAEGQAAGIDKPGPLPCQALDHGSGYLMAFGAMAALSRRMREGGSWHVRVSLAQTAHWLRHLGRLPDGLAVPDTTFEAVKDLLEIAKSGHGTADRRAPCRRLDENTGALGPAGHAAWAAIHRSGRLEVRCLRPCAALLLDVSVSCGDLGSDHLESARIGAPSLRSRPR